MKEELNYISDEALERLILDVEQNELVTAPPDLMEEVLAKLEKQTIRQVKKPPVKKKEFYVYCVRVITSVAAAVALVFLLPEVSGTVWQQMPLTEVNRQEIPSREEVGDTVPAKEEVLVTGKVPTKEEVLDDTGWVEKVFRDAGWIRKEEKGYEF